MKAGEGENTLEEYLNIRSDQLEELRHQTKMSIERAHAQSQAAFNQHARYPNYEVGDLVWVRNHGKTFIEKKWSAKYHGPYMVK